MSKPTENALSSWMIDGSAWQDVIMACRIRLARNLDDLPFPNIAKPDEKIELVSRVENLLPELTKRSQKSWQLLSLSDLSKEECGILIDKHLISRQFAQNPRWASLLISEDEAVSIMLNEEDHIRLQALYPGQQLRDALQIANDIDDILEEYLPYAFDAQLGYLTACPTNVGTGLRASVMVHLPALVISRKIGRVVTAVNEMGLVVRGLYGEGSDGIGQIYQISNQVTLGSSESEVIESLQGIAKQIVEEERNTRRILYNGKEMELLDRIGRSVGTLSNARMINSSEAVQLLSDLRLGINIQCLTGIDNQTVNALLVKVQTAWLSKHQEDEAEVIAGVRASILREALQGVKMG